MSFPFRIGERVATKDWHQIRRRAIFECCKWDVQSFDHCVLAEFPLWLSREAWTELCYLAEGLAAETIAAEGELLNRTELLPELSLPKAMIRELEARGASDSLGARVMRFDFHFTDEGWRISEVNSDVPGGFVEGSGFTQLMAEYFDASGPTETAEEYVTAVLDCARGGVIAMAHATAYSDDRQVMQYLAQFIRRHGFQAVQVSPGDVKWRDNVAWVCSKYLQERVAAIVRFFPADWLTEMPGWRDFLGGNGTPISNPATALLTQSKAFPLVWNRLRSNLPFWRKLLPETRAASQVDVKSIGNEWVLKPVFGRVGENIGMTGVTLEAEMGDILQSAKRDPKHWILQRRFRALPVMAEGRDFYPCIGVYTVNGKAAGAYGRLAPKPLTDDEAQDVALLFERNGK